MWIKNLAVAILASTAITCAEKWKFRHEKEPNRTLGTSDFTASEGG
ncbi:hypothetical protein [Pantoea sp. OXWO6B1]|nr:hypothetical protein [Pantoea sp. OXWO6B1]